MNDSIAERPPLTLVHTDRLTQALDKAYAIAMLLSVADQDVGHTDDAAMAVLDYLDQVRAELAKLTEASHG